MNATSSDLRWKEAVWQRRLAHHYEEVSMQRALFVGRGVEWMHGNSVVSGEVVGHGYGPDDVIVRGDRSGKEYRLSAWRILDHMGLNPAYPAPASPPETPK